MDTSKTLVESAGAEYVAERDGVVYFRACDDCATISLYAFALRSTEDVRLALKARLEPVADFPPLLPSE
jgi:hypothetical protein